MKFSVWVFLVFVNLILAAIDVGTKSYGAAVFSGGVFLWLLVEGHEEPQP